MKRHRRGVRPFRFRGEMNRRAWNAWLRSPINHALTDALREYLDDLVTGRETRVDAMTKAVERCVARVTAYASERAAVRR